MAAVAAAAGAACGAAPAGPKPTPERLAAGERAYQKCTSCHALEAGKNTPAGPTLHRIVGRRIAAEPGFDYSPALRRFAERHRRWDPALLERIIADAEALVPGTTMSFHGIADPDERRALLLYLEQGAASSR